MTPHYRCFALLCGTLPSPDITSQCVAVTVRHHAALCLHVTQRHFARTKQDLTARYFACTERRATALCLHVTSLNDAVPLRCCAPPCHYVASLHLAVAERDTTLPCHCSAARNRTILGRHSTPLSFATAIPHHARPDQTSPVRNITRQHLTGAARHLTLPCHRVTGLNSALLCLHETARYFARTIRRGARLCFASATRHAARLCLATTTPHSAPPLRYRTRRNVADTEPNWTQLYAALPLQDVTLHYRCD